MIQMMPEEEYILPQDFKNTKLTDQFDPKTILKVIFPNNVRLQIFFYQPNSQISDILEKENYFKPFSIVSILQGSSNLNVAIVSTNIAIVISTAVDKINTIDQILKLSPKIYLIGENLNSFKFTHSNIELKELDQLYKEPDFNIFYEQFIYNYPLIFKYMGLRDDLNKNSSKLNIICNCLLAVFFLEYLIQKKPQQMTINTNFLHQSQFPLNQPQPQLFSNHPQSFTSSHSNVSQQQNQTMSQSPYLGLAQLSPQYPYSTPTNNYANYGSVNIYVSNYPQQNSGLPMNSYVSNENGTYFNPPPSNIYEKQMQQQSYLQQNYNRNPMNQRTSYESNSFNFQPSIQFPNQQPPNNNNNYNFNFNPPNSNEPLYQNNGFNFNLNHPTGIPITQQQPQPNNGFNFVPHHSNSAGIPITQQQPQSQTNNGFNFAPNNTNSTGIPITQQQPQSQTNNGFSFDFKPPNSNQNPSTPQQPSNEFGFAFKPPNSNQNPTETTNTQQTSNNEFNSDISRSNSNEDSTSQPQQASNNEFSFNFNRPNSNENQTEITTPQQTSNNGFNFNINNPNTNSNENSASPIQQKSNDGFSFNFNRSNSNTNEDPTETTTPQQTSNNGFNFSFSPPNSNENSTEITTPQQTSNDGFNFSFNPPNSNSNSTSAQQQTPSNNFTSDFNPSNSNENSTEITAPQQTSNDGFNFSFNPPNSNSTSNTESQQTQNNGFSFNFNHSNTNSTSSSPPQTPNDGFNFSINRSNTTSPPQQTANDGFNFSFTPPNNSTNSTQQRSSGLNFPFNSSNSTETRHPPSTRPITTPPPPRPPPPPPTATGNAFGFDFSIRTENEIPQPFRQQNFSGNMSFDFTIPQNDESDEEPPTKLPKNEADRSFNSSRSSTTSTETDVDFNSSMSYSMSSSMTSSSNSNTSGSNSVNLSRNSGGSYISHIENGDENDDKPERNRAYVPPHRYRQVQTKASFSPQQNFPEPEAKVSMIDDNDELAYPPGFSGKQYQ